MDRSEETHAVFISISRSHAIVFVLPKQVALDALHQQDLFIGQAFDNISPGRVPRKSWASHYHITLKNNKYYLEKRYDGDLEEWIRAGTTYFLGYTQLNEDQFDLLVTDILKNKFHEQYKLTVQDCLEFAKEVGRRVAVEENGMDSGQIERILGAMVVSDGSLELVEYSSRNSAPSGQSAASSYASSRRSDDLKQHGDL